MAHNSSIRGFFAVIVLVWTCLAKQCYLPDGSAVSLDYQPCDTNLKHDMCCATNRTVGRAINSCDPLRICSDGQANVWWRESCTDPTWQDPGCLKLCIDGLVQVDGVKVNLSSNEVIITKCQDKSYCCGEKASACCENGGGYRIKNNTVFGNDWGSPETFNPFKFVAVTSDGRNNASAIAAPANGGNNANPKSQDAMKIGLGVGLGVGISVLVLLAANLVVTLRKKRGIADASMQRPAMGDRQNSGYPPSGPQIVYVKNNTANLHVVEMEQPKAELYPPTPVTARQPMIEMDAWQADSNLNEPPGSKKTGT